MKRLKASTAAKIVAALLTTASLAAFIICLVGVFGLDTGGFYRIGQEKMLQDGYGRVCEKYSIVALADYQGEFNKSLLSQTNFRYGVLEADDIKKVDLSDPSQYLVSNFEKMPQSEEDVYLYQERIHENTAFSYGTKIWEPFYVHQNTADTRYVDTEYPFHGYYYDVTEETLYARSQKKLFPVHVSMIYAEGELYSQEFIESTYVRGYTPGEQPQDTDVYSWDDQIIGVETVNGNYLDIKDIQIVDHSKLKKLGKISQKDVETITDETIYTIEEIKVPGKSYLVVSYVQQPLQGEQSFSAGDMFVQEKLIVHFLYQVRYLLIVILFIASVCLLVSFIFLMSAAGHHKGQEGIVPRFLDKAPLDLYLIGEILAEAALFSIVAVTANQAYSWNYPVGTEEHIIFWVVLVLAGAAGCLLALLYCMSLAVNIKIGKWWQRTALYWISVKCLTALRACIRFFVKLIQGFIRSISLLWKVWLVLGGIAIAELFVIGITAYDPQTQIIFWFLEKCILYPILIILFLQMDKLQKSAQRIANGELNYKLNTDSMYWELRKHGEYLNAIGTGMNLAVNERLKSERFKTELITNVSHDIKTPLTSIINYIDLLQKEHIDNPVAQDYLEVLQRQSARLKKLIEDLIEASKASSGSLSVCMEQCDAGVMLIQTVGEFEEKLMQNQIVLQITRPQEDIFIEADSRHLWRVFDNLMNNICKYAQPMTRAYVNLEQDEKTAVITFRNISKYPLNISSEELMERFVRGDSSRNTEGSGLGISIAKSLTELMDGTFTLIVDGDLFKVVLAFPLYGMRRTKSQIEFSEGESAKEPLKERWQTAVSSSIQQAGTYAKDIGQSVTDKTGRAFYRAGRLAHHMKQAVRQTKDEAQAERRQQEQQQQEEWIQEQMQIHASTQPQPPFSNMQMPVQEYPIQTEFGTDPAVGLAEETLAAGTQGIDPAVGSAGERE